MKYITICLLFLSTLASSQTETTQKTLSEILCEKLRHTETVPIAYATATYNNAPLPPAPCNAKSNYGTFPNKITLNQSGYWVVYEQVRIVTETIQNGKTCVETETVLEKQITEIGREYINPNKPRPNVYVIRMELMVDVPTSRPLGTKAYRINFGSYPNYVITGWGEFIDQNAALIALDEFRKQYPEFCQAHVFYIPGDGYSELYEYITTSHDYE